MTNKTFYLHSGFETKSFKKSSKSLKIAGYANTTAKDRSGDVVTAEAWAKGIDNFRRNPVLLYQHKHDAPIGRVDKIVVDKKGIFVEASVSEAAERTMGTQTLIKDGALKSFSVGFKVKNGKYNRSDDSMTITDVELLEISVVSVPCNQDSLFSIKKSFDSDSDYSDFIKEFSDDEEIKEMELIDNSGLEEISIEEEEVESMSEKTQTITTESIEETNDVEDTIEVKATEETPTDEQVEETIEVTEEKTVADTIETKEIVETEEEKSETVEAIQEDDDEELIESDPNEQIPFINLLSVDINDGDIIKHNDKTYIAKKSETDQTPLFEFLEIDAESSDSDNTYIENKQSSEDEASNKSITEELHEDSTKENDIMADQVVDSINLEAAASEVSKSVNTVAEPRVANLVEKTGEAILAQADAQDKYGEQKAVRETDEMNELKSQISKYKDEIAALQTSKMHYQENSRRSSQFSEKEMANAVLLAKMLNKGDVFDTKFGSRMKAVTTVDAFLSNFSENVYSEMEQKLVIAPLFTRLPVDAKTFRVPVADEDTDGDVAMFRNGTYATGIADTTNVPTSNQHSISSVEFTPHKFMASTHLAKDEEEDTVLPLVNFLREAATRRMARAIDKSILRGTGALTGFTASPTNAITAGTGYASVIEGITNLTSDASLEVATGSATDKADPSDIAAARAQMGKYGLQTGGDLVFITSIEGYNNLVTTSDFQTVDKFGAQATYLTGSVGSVYGIPIITSEFLDGVGTAGNHLGVLMYKPGFMIAERRGMEIESEYEPRQQVTAMYMSTRFDFKALTTNSSAALDTSKYMFASTIVAGA